MKWSFTLVLSLFFTLFGTSLKAQLSCEYTLELFDSFGDGWNGSMLTVTINGTPTIYTLNNITDDGSYNLFSITITDGDEVNFGYSPGIFEGEVSYVFTDPDGIVVFEDGTEFGVNPTVGDSVFTATLGCPSCPVAPPSSVSIGDVRAFTADLSWSLSDPDGVYLIEYDTTGFEPGTGGNIFEATGNGATLTGLQEHTAYDFYLSVACANGDTSVSIGPYSFMTLWAIDVGVIEILSPESQCGLGIMDTIEVTLQNFGGLPQSLIPFNFSVNGTLGGVNQPVDGFFTGVLGTDSIFTIPFETFFDLSIPGVYEIMAWTELDGDSDLTNDTTTFTITNIPIVTEYPYFTDFEEWNGGWSVDPESNNPSWEFGMPNNGVINTAASGVNAWMTGLESNYNNNEVSYLISPCLDFSSLEEDPRIAFSINFNGESCCDEGWVELSIDGGESWTKVGTSGTGNNWYNDPFNNWWDGTGGFDGWVSAFNVLEGAAGASDARVRFVFSSDFSVVFEGFAVDDIFISPPLANDLATLEADHTSGLPCGEEFDMVTMSITNVGTDPQTGFDVSYQVNGGTIVTENVGPLTILPDQTADYTFNTTFDSSIPGEYEVAAWTDLPNELFLPNDTASFSFATALSIPFSEDFESGTFPDGWTTDDGFVTNAHNNASFVIADNLWSFDTQFMLTSPIFGLVEAGDTLTFDYRFVNFSGGGIIPTILGENDSLTVQLTTDCGMSYETVFVINSENQDPGNILVTQAIPLDEYAGGTIGVRFMAQWGEGDYWVDLDNINIKRCPLSLDLSAELQGATGGQENGVATIIPGAGLGPYTFFWSNGDFGPTADSLAVGDYTVTVIDAVGCSDIIDLSVIVSTEDLPEQISTITLAPNPTSGLTNLKVQFANPVDAQIQLVNLMGQVVFNRLERNVLQSEYDLNLNNYPSGMYLVRVVVENEVKTEKLIKVSR